MERPFAALRRNYRRRAFAIAVQAVRSSNGDLELAKHRAEEDVRQEYGSILAMIVMGVLVHYAVKAVIWLIENALSSVPDDAFEQFENGLTE